MDGVEWTSDETRKSGVDEWSGIIESEWNGEWNSLSDGSRVDDGIEWNGSIEWNGMESNRMSRME